MLSVAAGFGVDRCRPSARSQMLPLVGSEFLCGASVPGHRIGAINSLPDQSINWPCTAVAEVKAAECLMSSMAVLGLARHRSLRAPAVSGGAVTLSSARGADSGKLVCFNKVRRAPWMATQIVSDPNFSYELRYRLLVFRALLGPR